MLLLYLDPDSCTAVNSPIYIPLCFYFIRTGTGRTTTVHPIYIPLCFYFIVASIGLTVASIIIYIPLCFYFIFQACIISEVINDNLHSTMLLLYLLHYLLINLFKIIYIPLCFYFIGVTSMCISGSSCIYIPLCFYFIHREKDRGVLFHNLHSTMLLLYPLLSFHILPYLCTFTFHYASTLSSVADSRRPQP